MDAFLTGKPTHWTLPGLFGMALSETGIEQGLALQRRAARFLLGKEGGEPGAAWDALRGTAMGRLVPSWPELLVAIRNAYGEGPEAMRRALRGEMTRNCDPALFHELDLEEVYCDFLAVWIVSIRYGLPPEELLEASAVGRAALEGQDVSAWSALAALLAQARIPCYAQMDFVQASDTALEWALKMPGLKEKWMLSDSQDFSASE